MGNNTPREVLAGMLREQGVAASGHALTTCGATTGHFVQPIAFCKDADIAAILAAALTPATVGTAWQPIESAPKDGTWLLLWLRGPYSRVALARWYAPWSNWQANDLPYDPAREEHHGIGSSVPTHWMPSPTPPTKEVGDA